MPCAPPALRHVLCLAFPTTFMRLRQRLSLRSSGRLYLDLRFRAVGACHGLHRLRHICGTAYATLRYLQYRQRVEAEPVLAVHGMGGELNAAVPCGSWVPPTFVVKVADDTGWAEADADGLVTLIGVGERQFTPTPAPRTLAPPCSPSPLPHDVVPVFPRAVMIRAAGRFYGLPDPRNDAGRQTRLPVRRHRRAAALRCRLHRRRLRESAQQLWSFLSASRCVSFLSADFANFSAFLKFS